MFMKNIIALICISIIGATTLFAQQQNQQILKPVIQYSEIDFCLQLLKNIELRGNEVDALMEVRSIMISQLQKATKENKKPEESTTLEFTINQAQNLLAFLQRALLTGAVADRYKRFTDAIKASAQPKK
jgi:predicted ATP-dependent Lon-type protease